MVQNKNEIVCECGEVTYITDDEVLSFAITECPDCGADIEHDDSLYDAIMERRELSKTIYQEGL